VDATEALSLAEKLAKQLASRQQDIFTRDAYYAGEQKLKFATTQWSEAHAKRYEGFSDNWSGVVADSPAERVQVTGFRLDDSAQMSEAEKALWRSTWQSNDLDAQSAQGFLEAFVAARSFALVWGDSDDKPVITWEHPAQVLVSYDPENPRVALFAVKRWHDDDREYLSLYTRTEVWKWAAARASSSGLVLPSTVGGRSWQPREDDDVWPLTHPLERLPMVELANRPRLGGEPMSDIAGTMAMQDAINLLWAYLFNAADFASMPSRVVMGQAPPMVPVLDDQGQKVGEVPVDEKKLIEGRMLWLTGQNSSIGSWPAANLNAFTDVVEVAVGHVAAQTRTPQHYLVGKMANLSGDALKAAETGLVKKCQEAQLHFTAPIREIFRLSALVQGDQAAADAAALGTVKWKDAESRSEAQLVDALQKMDAIGFPFEYLAERYGLADTEITRVLAMIEKEQTAAKADPVLGDIAAKLTGPVPGGSTAPAVGA
jgi:hypothetical protein